MTPLNYASMRAGTEVIIDGHPGVVVFSSISNTYLPDFPISEWPNSRYEGLMIRQENGALIFHEAESLLKGDFCVEVVSRV